MFDSIRSHRRWLMLFLTLLVFPSFVVTGIYGWNRMTSVDDAVANVGGEPITPQQFEAAHRERIGQIRQSLGENFDMRVFDTPAARLASLQAMLGDRALRREAAGSFVAVSDRRLQQVIGAEPAFQQDGRFSFERYKTLLAAQGMNEAVFEQRLRDDLSRRMLLEGVARSAIVPAAVAERLQHLVEETRTVRERRFRPEEFLARAAVTDEAIKAHYEGNRQQFEIRESIKAEFIALTLEDVAQGIAVPPAELQTYYEQNKASFTEAEQRRASHILLTVGEGGSAKDKDGARKLAQELLAKLRAQPDDFARLAREYSKDPGSAANGGDLGLFGRNMMVKPFEDVAFRLKVGELSEVVDTEFGLHIIKVTETKGGAVRPFDQVKGEIEATYRQQQAQKKFAEAAEQFTNLVYEQSDSLKPAADKLKLTIRSVDSITRDGLPSGAPEAALLIPAVVQALFADEALVKKRNIKAVEAGSGTLVSARVVEHRPARLRPFDEVKGSIRERLLRDDATRQAREAAAAAAIALQAAPDQAGFAPPRAVTRMQAEGLSPAAIRAVMQVPADKLPAYVTAEVDGGAQAVFWVLEAKQPVKSDAGSREQLVRGVERQVAAADDLVYVESLKRKHKAEVVGGELKAAAKKDDGTEKK